MQVIFFLIAIGILVAGGFLAAFIWSVKSGQYDDDYTPSVRMLFDNFKDSTVEESSDITEKEQETKENEAQSKQSNNNKS